MPGISDKLYPPRERKLEKVKKYWKLLSELAPIHEIYGENRLAPENISIDHFVPWSYVAHDEFWNLHPTTRAINSSKSNRLPEWELYFPRFAGLEYLSYQMIWKYEAVRNEFKKCAREHLNNPVLAPGCNNHLNLRTFFWTLFTKVIRVLHDIPLGLIRLASS